VLFQDVSGYFHNCHAPCTRAFLAHNFSAIADRLPKSVAGIYFLSNIGDDPMDTSNSELQSLAARLERLEKQYHWLMSEVVTEKLALVDSDGKTRATLHMTEEVPSLILYDSNGNVRAILRVSAEGPSLHLLDSRTKAGLELSVGEAGPDVSLFDANGKQRLSLDIAPHESGLPGLTMRDPNGKPSVVARALENSPGVCLFDTKNPDGNTSVQITMGSEGPSLICVKEGKVLWSAP
jgi:hypothetical protein